MSHSLSSLLTHVVFSTKDRIPCISNEIKRELCSYIGGIVREIGGKALIVNGTGNHVHVLLQLSPVISIADAMRLMKTNSSRWARQKWPAAKFSWQVGYGAFSVSRLEPGPGCQIHKKSGRTSQAHLVPRGISRIVAEARS